MTGLDRASCLRQKSGHALRQDKTIPLPTLADPRTYIWTPAPYVADVALAELRKVRIKRQDDIHIFVCPRLCTHLWFRLFFKAMDLVTSLPAGHSAWPEPMHEPLLISFMFPGCSLAATASEGTMVKNLMLHY